MRESCFGPLSEWFSCRIDIFTVAYYWARGSKSGGSPFQYLTAIFTLNAPSLLPSSFLSRTHTHLHTCRWAHIRSWQFWSAVRWGHDRMTAVTETPLPPSQQGIKDKQTSKEELKLCVRVCVCALCRSLCPGSRVTGWQQGVPSFSYVEGSNTVELSCFLISSRVSRHNGSKTTPIKHHVPIFCVWSHTTKSNAFIWFYWANAARDGSWDEQ